MGQKASDDGSTYGSKHGREGTRRSWHKDHCRHDLPATLPAHPTTSLVITTLTGNGRCIKITTIYGLYSVVGNEFNWPLHDTIEKTRQRWLSILVRLKSRRSSYFNIAIVQIAQSEFEKRNNFQKRVKCWRRLGLRQSECFKMTNVRMMGARLEHLVRGS
jgi:hypothetical protein